MPSFSCIKHLQERILCRNRQNQTRSFLAYLIPPCHSVGNTENTANIKALFFHEFHNQSTPVKILKSYLASNEMAKPPPRASLIFKTSPFFTVL